QLAAARDSRLRTLQDATAGAASPAPPAPPSGGAVRATPAARRLARERGIDLATIHGSGPGGMITVDDLPG
ncbi:MAG TPA: E3 binding domain-containing protein, partial [Armatimonadota bacterium]|nr:E3 binding domain-containing protein [Armatimonadota bacterium]